MKYCHQCGHLNDEKAQYCENDGIRLESLDMSYKYEMQPGDFCTSCGHVRQGHHIYCATCGHHALEPKIGVNRVEESLKSVAATGSQVFAQLKRATTTRQIPDYKHVLRHVNVRPDLPNMIRGSVFALIFLVVVFAFSALLVSYIPSEFRQGLSEVFGGEASTFKIFSLVAFTLMSNLYWSLDIESLLLVSDELDDEAMSFLTQYPMFLDGKLGNYFFVLGGILLVIGLAFLLFRNVRSWQEGWGRFLGMFLTLVVSLFLLSLFAMDLIFIESRWFLTTITTWFSFILAIGLGALLSIRANGIWKAAQQGGRAIITVTIFSMVVGASYLGYQMVKLNDMANEMTGYGIATASDEYMVAVGQGFVSNWQNLGHGGTQELEMQSPIISLEVGSSSFGTTTPREIEKSINQLDYGVTDLEYMIEDMVEYGEFPREEYAPAKELPVLSPSLIGLIRQVSEASFAEDEIEVNRLYNEGIFSWFQVLVFINILIYTAFAYRTVVSKERLAAFVITPFLIYLIWQWFLGGGMTFTTGERELFNVSIHNLGLVSTSIALLIMTSGGALGWLLGRKTETR